MAHDLEYFNWRANYVEPAHLPASSEKEQRLATYKPRNESQEKLLAAVQEFLADKIQPPLLLMAGTPGLGKTHLAWAVAWEYLEDYRHVYYYQAEELLDELRNSFTAQAGTYGRRVERIREVALLIIDDLGAQSSTDFGVAKLDMIIDYRYRERLPTIITSNTLELPDRILDRFREGAIIIVKGESYRKERPHVIRKSAGPPK